MSNASLAPAGIECRLDADPGRVTPETARALGLIVCELDRNAAKHAFSGERARDPVIVVSLRRTSPAWRLVVSDNGPGMGTAAPQSGSGLGLALVRSLARSIGGEVDIESGPGGTAVAVSFDPIRVAS